MGLRTSHKAAIAALLAWLARHQLLHTQAVRECVVGPYPGRLNQLHHTEGPVRVRGATGMGDRYSNN